MTQTKTKQTKNEAKAPSKTKQVFKGLLWLYAAVFFTATAVLVFKAYDHYVTTFIALQQLSIAVVIVVTHFIKTYTK